MALPTAFPFPTEPVALVPLFLQERYEPQASGSDSHVLVLQELESFKERVLGGGKPLVLKLCGGTQDVAVRDWFQELAQKNRLLDFAVTDVSAARDVCSFLLQICSFMVTQCAQKGDLVQQQVLSEWVRCLKEAGEYWLAPRYLFFKDGSLLFPHNFGHQYASGAQQLLNQLVAKTAPVGSCTTHVAQRVRRPASIQEAIVQYGMRTGGSFLGRAMSAKLCSTL